MTLEEAIEYQEADKSGVVFNQQARQLGIEALKAVILERETYAFERIPTLPGETYIPQSVGKLPSDE